MNPKITNVRSEKVISPWITLVTHTITTPEHPAPRDFHSLKQADYMGLLAVTADGKVICVRQYRPSLDRFTLELPAGLVDPGEEPATTAVRELEEETGFRVAGKIHTLGGWAADTGRLENRIWAYFAPRAEPIAGAKTEPGVEVVLLSKAEFKEAMVSGAFDHALHVAVVGMALVQGHFSFQADDRSAS